MVILRVGWYRVSGILGVGRYSVSGNIGGREV